MKGSVKAHISLLLAASMWGLMSPVGKAAMEAGITGLTLANMRMIGAAVCFWTTSFFVKQEKVNPHDLLMLFFASLLGIVCNQGCFTFGLSLTSPVDASIMTTTMPIVTMILAALFLKEPVTPKKVIGDISWVHRCPDLDSEQPRGRYGRGQRMGGRPLHGSSD